MEIKLTTDPDELVSQFLKLEKPEGVAELLGIDYDTLTFHTYRNPLEKRYRRFYIPKKSGGFREIHEPITGLKIIQQKLNDILLALDENISSSAHGFVKDRSILTNAKLHSSKKFVINIDLLDFFPSINFGRVYGLFSNEPFVFNNSVAAVLANVCCFMNKLPQGAPTSPIISNMICWSLDKELSRLAKKHRCTYSRYADDITFSCTASRFPNQLAEKDRNGEVLLGEELYRIIENNGFFINPSKIRFQTRNMRQVVTGLTVNYRPNVSNKYKSQIRAMLYSWEKFGLDKAQEEYLLKYDKKHRLSEKYPPSFEHVVRGKIEFFGMVRGKTDPLYLQYKAKYNVLSPDNKSSVVVTPSNLPVPFIFTEGKTDWMHLKSAFREFKKDLYFAPEQIKFDEFLDSKGDNNLLNECKILSKVPHKEPLILIFDRDKKVIVEEVSNADGYFKDWGNRVYSFAIPVPSHRTSTPNVCIELYYKESDLLRTDEAGRRIFLSTEFFPRSGRHKSGNYVTHEINKVKGEIVTIIESSVFDDKENSVALSKSDFAENILKQTRNFEGIDFSEFRLIFKVILEILEYDADKYSEIFQEYLKI